MQYRQPPIRADGAKSPELQPRQSGKWRGGGKSPIETGVASSGLISRFCLAMQRVAGGRMRRDREVPMRSFRRDASVRISAARISAVARAMNFVGGNPRWSKF